MWAGGCCGGHPSVHADMRNQIKALRTARGWTQAELAERADVSRQTVIAVEADKYDPSLPLAFRLAAIFEKPVEAVFDNPYVGAARSMG